MNLRSYMCLPSPLVDCRSFVPDKVYLIAAPVRIRLGELAELLQISLGLYPGCPLKLEAPFPMSTIEQEYVNG